MVFPLLHFSIAFGCQMRSEIAQVISRVTGVLMMPMCPIGAVIGIIIFENTEKKFTEEHIWLGNYGYEGLSLIGSNSLLILPIQEANSSILHAYQSAFRLSYRWCRIHRGNNAG